MELLETSDQDAFLNLRFPVWHSVNADSGNSKKSSDLVFLEIAKNAAFLKIELARVERGLARMLALCSRQGFRNGKFLQVNRKPQYSNFAFQMVNSLD